MILSWDIVLLHNKKKLFQNKGIFAKNLPVIAKKNVDGRRGRLVCPFKIRHEEYQPIRLCCSYDVFVRFVMPV